MKTGLFIGQEEQLKVTVWYWRVIGGGF